VIGCEGGAVTALYAIGGVVSVAILIYLFVAMLKPEWF
jgi:K+-transporting ATPase KdpF subunit